VYRGHKGQYKSHLDAAGKEICNNYFIKCGSKGKGVSVFGMMAFQRWGWGVVEI
jgi:hypothetical protein